MAFVFQRAGKASLTERQVRHHVSMDLRWFPPKQARRFVEACLERGLLEEAGGGGDGGDGGTGGEDGGKGGLRPTFDVRGVDVPLGFRPRLPSGPPTDLDAVIDRLTERADLSREQAVARINKEQARFDGLVDPEVAGLIVARELDVAVDDLLGRYLGRGVGSTDGQAGKAAARPAPGDAAGEEE